MYHTRTQARARSLSVKLRSVWSCQDCGSVRGYSSVIHHLFRRVRLCRPNTSCRCWRNRSVSRTIHRQRTYVHMCSCMFENLPTTPPFSVCMCTSHVGAWTNVQQHRPVSHPSVFGCGLTVDMSQHPNTRMNDYTNANAFLYVLVLHVRMCTCVLV